MMREEAQERQHLTSTRSGMRARLQSAANEGAVMDSNSGTSSIVERLTIQQTAILIEF